MHVHRGEEILVVFILGRALRWGLRRVSGWPTLDSCARVGWYLQDVSMGVVTRCDRSTPFGREGWAARDQRIVVCVDPQSMGQQAFLPHVRALTRTNGLAVGGGGGVVAVCGARVCGVGHGGHPGET